MDPAHASSRYQIQRDDGQRDTIAGRCFSSYDEAYAMLERYYGDLCCSDDREYYRIVELCPADPLT
jgi:hypothetical protein